MHTNVVVPAAFNLSARSRIVSGLHAPKHGGACCCWSILIGWPMVYARQRETSLDLLIVSEGFTTSYLLPADTKFSPRTNCYMTVACCHPQVKKTE